MKHKGWHGRSVFLERLALLMLAITCFLAGVQVTMHYMRHPLIGWRGWSIVAFGFLTVAVARLAKRKT